MKKITHTLILIALFISYLSSAQVSQNWVSLFNYGEPNSEEPTDMIVDSEGNIYITGWTFGNNSYDFITIKYNATGELLWSQSYDGPMHSSDQAEAIAVDNSGNVYVIGSSQTQTYGDITIIKYSPDGEQIWLQYYDNNSSDYGYDIGIGENGMIYAVGLSNSNMITLQYNTEGMLQWVATYNGADEEGLDIATDLVLDASSSVYITGFTKGVGGFGTNRDITTIKYNAEGVQQWVAIYDGPGNASDEGYDIALDEMNNVYVVGYTNVENGHVQFATIKYNENGQEEWVSRYFNPETLNGAPSAIAVFDSDNIYVTGSEGLGVSIVKINNAGDTVWTKQYNRGYADQKGTDIITDQDGNIYVTGWVRVETGMWGRDYGTMKYNPDGELLWDIWYQGLGEERDDPKKICLDDQNNVIITGQTNAGTTSYDIGTIKYIQSPDAVKELWSSHARDVELEIFPNPVKDKCTVKRAKYTAGTAQIELYDLNGRILIEKLFPVGSETMEIDVSNLESGVYFCQLHTENKSVTKKLIIK